MKLNWDKQSVLAVVIGLGIIVAWGPVSQKMGWSSAPQKNSAATTEIAASNKNEVPAATANGNAVSGATTPVQTADVAATQNADTLRAWEQTYPAVTLCGSKADFVISPVTGIVEQIVLHDYPRSDADRQPIVLDNTFDAARDGQKATSPFVRHGALAVSGDMPFQVLEVVSSETTENSLAVVRRMATSGGAIFYLEQQFSICNDYELEMRLRLTNRSGADLNLGMLAVSAGDLQTWNVLSGDPFRKSQEIHTFDFLTAAGKMKHIATDAKKGKLADWEGSGVQFLGLANRYFALLLKSTDSLELSVDRMELPENRAQYLATATGVRRNVVIKANESADFVYSYFAGPKLPSELKKFDGSASKVLRLGWFPIDFFAHIMLFLLNWIEGFVGSYGWSIILLTLLVRTLFFPITMKANASMRAMQELQPEMRAIKEKYKDEAPQVAQTKIMELYREKHINPAGGCLPMLIQIPVFIALYYALGSAVELRLVSFWWIEDLARPDTVASIFGLPINPLIIAWTLLMLLQQKITPTTMDPMQAKMMLAMPLVMLYMLYDLPSGLTLYWAVSQIFSLAQLYYQQHTRKKEESKKAASGTEPGGMRGKTVRS